MATKEVMASAPLMVLLYDRTFIAGTFRESWQRRRLLYALLGGSWLLLASLIASGGGNRSGIAGFGVGVPWWEYWLTQCIAIVHHLRLAVWPVDLWRDTVTKRPENFLAHHLLGSALEEAGELDAGVAHDREALRLEAAVFQEPCEPGRTVSPPWPASPLIPPAGDDVVDDAETELANVRQLGANARLRRHWIPVNRQRRR
jgi:hypothetical protein